MKQSETLLEVSRIDSVATTPEAREQQLIAKAERLAEKKLDDGTASSDLIKHFLERDTQKRKLEVEKLKCEKDLIEAKIKALHSAAKIEELYEDAMSMFKMYSGTNE